MRSISVGLLGLGNVGSGVVKLLDDNAEAIRHRLGGASSVQTALAALVRDDVIARDGARYIVVDSLLREWVARHTF